MVFSRGAEVSSSRGIKALWFEERQRDVPRRQRNQVKLLTPVDWKHINVYIDWRDFRIRPWKRGLEHDEIPFFLKSLLRNFERLEADAQEYKREKEQMRRKPWRSIGYQGGAEQSQRPIRKTSRGVAPTPQAATNYMKYREQAIASHEKARVQKHERLVRQQQARERRAQRKKAHYP
jgi:hypothetical protein